MKFFIAVDSIANRWHTAHMQNCDTPNASSTLNALQACVAEVAAFSITEPAIQHFPLVISSPHSGRYYPQYFVDASRLDPVLLRASEDYYVDKLIVGALELGVPTLTANYPRAFIDLNREPYELDQRMFDDKLPAHVNASSLRVASGLGTIARIVAANKEIYQTKIATDEAMARIDDIYRPWHQALGHQIAKTRVEFGTALLLDCHSMPSGSKSIGSNKKFHPTKKRADFVVGDRYGTSCQKEIADATVDFLRNFGFNVVRNKPYAGGFIAEHYGRPAKKINALQIEINRALYVNEMSLKPSENFDAVQKVMTKLFAHLGQITLTLAEERDENLEAAAE